MGEPHPGAGNLRPVQPGQVGADHPRTTHGATSEALIRPLARNHRRRVLRQLRLRSGDLDPIGKGYLDLYVRAVAKVEAMDRYAADYGFLDAKGKPRGFAAVYVSMLNSARLALARLEDHLCVRVEDEPLAILEGEGRRLRLAAEAREGP
jgi:hypothetical protein